MWYHQEDHMQARYCTYYIRKPKWTEIIRGHANYYLLVLVAKFQRPGCGKRKPHEINVHQLIMRIYSAVSLQVISEN